MFQAGDRIGPYMLRRQIGIGGMGIVWLAERHTAFGISLVALKMPLSDQVDMDLIAQEVETWRKASGHDNVLSLLDADVYDGQVVLVSEYAPDGSLRDWMQRFDGMTPPLDAALTMMNGILSGLNHLHERGIVHRDLKPRNILMQGQTPRLTDFGISRVVKTTSYATTAAGTPSYMAPEAFDGKFSHRSDIWAAGILLYELLSGRLPYAQQEMASLWKAIAHQEPPSLPPHLPAHLHSVVERALAKDLVQRYPSAKAMLQALQGAPLLASNPSLSAPPFANSNPPPGSESRLSPSPLRNGRIALLTLLAIGVMGLGGTAGYIALHNRPESGIPGSRSASGMPSNPSSPKSGEGANPNSSTSNPNAIVTSKINPKDGAEMILIPAGSFLMGDSELSDKPHRTEHTESYYIYKYPVTVKQYLKFCSETGHDKPIKPFNGWRDNDPIVNVSWDDAQDYCKWASKGGVAVRLPTEKEWEKAARGTDGRKYPWGDEWDGSRCVNSVKPFHADQRESVYSHPEGKSPFGVMHMAGNVFQWCENKDVPQKERRALRGFTWCGSNVIYFRSGSRIRDTVYIEWNDDGGFRCASGT